MKELLGWLAAAEPNQAEYQEWLNNPTTKRVLRLFRLGLRPEPVGAELLASKPLELTLAKHCEFIGKHWSVDFLENALNLLPTEVEDEEADYGATDTVREDYGEDFLPDADGRQE